MCCGARGLCAWQAGGALRVPHGLTAALPSAGRHDCTRDQAADLRAGLGMEHCDTLNVSLQMGSNKGASVPGHDGTGCLSQVYTLGTA